MKHDWTVGDICLLDTYARRDIKVQVKAIIWQKGVGEIYIVEETLAPFEKHICFENDLHEVGWS